MKTYHLPLNLLLIVTSLFAAQVLKASIFSNPLGNDKSLIASYGLDSEGTDRSDGQNHAVLAGPSGTTNRFGEKNKALEFSTL